jgi:hypothetical protein
MLSSLPRVVAAKTVRSLDSSAIYRYASKPNGGPFHNNKKIVYKEPRWLPTSYKKLWGRRMEGSGGMSGGTSSRFFNDQASVTLPISSPDYRFAASRPNGGSFLTNKNNNQCGSLSSHSGSRGKALECPIPFPGALDTNANTACQVVAAEAIAPFRRGWDWLWGKYPTAVGGIGLSAISPHASKPAPFLANKKQFPVQARRLFSSRPRVPLPPKAKMDAAGMLERIIYKALEKLKAKVKRNGIPRVGSDKSPMAEWEKLSAEQQMDFENLEYFLFRERLADLKTSGSKQIAVGFLKKWAKAIIRLCDQPLGEILVHDGNRPGYTHPDNKGRPDLFIFCPPDEFSLAPESRASILCLGEARSTDTGKGDLFKMATHRLEKSLAAGWPLHLLQDSEIPAYTAVGSFLQIGYLAKEGTGVKFYPCGDPIDVSNVFNAGKVAHALFRVQLGVKHLYEVKCIRNQVRHHVLFKGRVAPAKE